MFFFLVELVVPVILYKSPTNLIFIQYSQNNNHVICLNFQFSSKRKMGGEEFSQSYLSQLEIDLEETFSNFKAHNESKNIFKAARTPTVFFVIAIIMYILSGIFGLVGLYTFANFSNLVMGISLLTLALWGYIRYVNSEFVSKNFFTYN